MKKLINLTLLALIASFASYAQILPIFGSGHQCMGYTGYAMDSTSGGTWSSSNVAIATIGSTGAITPVSAGVVTITYTVGSSYVTAPFTVNPSPAAITGSLSGCVGVLGTLTDAVSGGVWTSSSPTIATVGSATGVVTGVSGGHAYIAYTLPGGCYATSYVTVDPTGAPDVISGPTTVCVGSTISLSDSTSGGVWTSSTTGVATVSGGGVVTGVSVGTTTITYTVTGGCGSGYVTYSVSVLSTVSAGTITGTTTVVEGGYTSLSDAVTGGTWTSGSTSVATISGMGLVYGVTAGTTNITYGVTGCGGAAYAYATVTVTTPPPADRISGHVNFSTLPADSLGVLKVWLITYDPITHMLGAVDSFATSAYSTSVYYEFLSEPADSYRVKAAYYPSTFTGTGFIPTYHTSSFYWSAANVIYHTTGTADDGEDINLAYGTVASGPGFIAGDVTTGANRGTSVTIPAVGVLIYAINASGNVMQQAYTDGAGHYSFSDLPLGTYTIYPEAINYHTTAYTDVTLTATAASMSTASFGQHSVSMTITPITTGIKTLASSVSSVIAFPNPTNGKLNIQWNETADEKGTVSVTDITGRVVYTSSININQGSGSSMLDLSTLNNGIYMMSIKSGTISYNNKIELQR